MTKEQLEALKAWVRAVIARQLASRAGDGACDHEYRVEQDAELALDEAFATPEDEEPNEARRWSAVPCGTKDRPNMCGVRDQFGNWYVERHDVRWSGGLGEAQAKVRELNRKALNI